LNGTDVKAAANLRKHGVAFEDAIAVFANKDAMTDPARAVGDERRLKTIGYADAQALLTVIHTERTVDGVS
jgi:uncharacterized protein